MNKDDPFARFLKAQGENHDMALAEMRQGRKRSHWMWYVFPQMAGLGHSPTSRYYALDSVGMAVDYLAHPVLGPRLVQATQVAIDAPALSLNALFGSPDDLKFRSSMTLFALVDHAPPIFRKALYRWCSGSPDDRTLRLAGVPAAAF